MTDPMAGRKKRTGRAKPRRAAPPRRPVLGNDPFERGAAAREPIRATPTPPPTPTPAATPTPLPAEPRTRPPLPTAAAATAAAATTRIHDVERRLDAALAGVEGRLQDLATRAGLAGAPGELREALRRLLPAVKERLAGAVDLLRLLEPADRLDVFGMDARFAARVEPIIELLYSSWWRVEVRGVAHVPAKGPAIVVANHAGAVPWDAVVLRHALRRERPGRQDLRPLLDDPECALPFFGPSAVRYGAVRASAESAERLLGDGQAIAVFPEGSAVARKPWRERYRIHRFGRGGFARIALRTGAPIVPCAIVGSEEASPGIARTGWLADRLGVPLLSANPSLRLPSAALLPLPSRWTVRFAAPLSAAGPDPAAGEDPVAVNALAERVRLAVQSMLDEGVAARSSVFL
jgi:1-acyl-sn-glycerol-3-phosphate acyltransferase